MTKLTTQYVRNVPPERKEFIDWDERLPGFGLRVKPSGVKSFVIQYRNKSKQQRRRVIGKFGTITADEAFKRAREDLAKVALGGDPAAEAEADRLSMRFSEFCSLYLEAAKSGELLTRRGKPKAASTLATDQGRIRSHIVPLLGSKLVKDISRDDIKKFMRDVQAGQTARNAKSDNLRGRSIVTGGAGTAKRTVGLLQGMLTFAVEEGLIERNPALGMRLPADKRRRVNNIEETYAAFGRSLELAEASGEHWQAILIMKLIAFTGMRRSEATELEWSSVDTMRQGVDLEISKTGESLRPVGKAVIDVIQAARDMHDNPRFVFPAVRSPDKPYGALPRAWDRIRNQESLTDRERELLSVVMPHKLRHALSTTGNAIGLTTATIGVLVGHKSHSVTEGYISFIDAVTTHAADRLTQKILDMMAGKQEERSAEIHAFKA